MSSCSGTDIFGDNSCEGGGGLTPGQEQDLDDVVEKTQLQSFVAPDTTNFNGNLTVNGLPVGGGGNPFDQSLNTTDQVKFEELTVEDSTGVNPDNSVLKKDAIEFRGIPADNALGRIAFDDGGSYKQIIMSVDKGNLLGQSRGIISVDGGNFQFNPNEFAMLNKRITLLSDPIGLLDATNKQYVDTALTDPVINSSITLENQTLTNTLVLASVATGSNRIESNNGNLEINGSNLTMNLTAGTLTENVGNNKISIISGNLTENISANKVSTISAAHISTALSHTFNGPLTSSTSVNTPLLSGISTITNAGVDININNIGGELIISNDALVVNSGGGIQLSGATFGIALGANQITTTKTTFIDTELVTKKYVDDAIIGSSSYELIFAVTDQVSLITTTGQKFQIRAPKDFSISKFKLSINSTAGASFSVTIFKNGSTVSSVFLPSLVQDTAITESFLENDIISVDISNIGLGTASGLIVYLIE